MSHPLNNLWPWFFDCDGVLLDSNGVKTEAFREVARSYGLEPAEGLVRHHIAHGGVSRFEKFSYFFDEILGRSPEDGEIERVLDEFGQMTGETLKTVDTDPSAGSLLFSLRRRGIPTYVVSGGLESEVRDALEKHGLAAAFDGIFGSPRDKADIVQEVLDAHQLSSGGVFVGDGRRDWEVARLFDMQFVFVKHWSEWDSPPSPPAGNWTTVEDLSDVIPLIEGGRIGQNEVPDG